jgi:hypothetical protein
MGALRDHFGRTDESLSPEQIAQMTGLDLTLVQSALRALKKMNRIEGIEVEEFNYPLQVTDVVW